MGIVISGDRGYIGQVFNVGLTDENFQAPEITEIVAATQPGCLAKLSPEAGADVRS